MSAVTTGIGRHGKRQCPPHAQRAERRLQLGRGLAGPGSRPAARSLPACAGAAPCTWWGRGSPEMPRIHSWLSLAVMGGAWSPWKWPVACSCFGDFGSAPRHPSVAPSELWKGPACHDGVRARHTAGAVAPDRGPGSPAPRACAAPGAWRPARGLGQSAGLRSPGRATSTLGCCCFAGPASPAGRRPWALSQGRCVVSAQASGQRVASPLPADVRWGGQAASSLLGEAEEPAAPEGHPRPQRGRRKSYNCPH